MSRFASALAGSVHAAHAHHFATSVVVTQAGTPITTPAVLHNAKAETRVVDGTTTQVITRGCRFTALTDLRDDATVTITTGGVSLDWSIDAIETLTGGSIVARLIRHVATEPARPGYRR